MSGTGPRCVRLPPYPSLDLRYRAFGRRLRGDAFKPWLARPLSLAAKNHPRGSFKLWIVIILSEESNSCWFIIRVITRRFLSRRSGAPAFQPDTPPPEASLGLFL